MEIQGIIFDMDGVLVDSEPISFERRNQFLQDRGFSLYGITMEKVMGGTFPDIWQVMSKSAKDMKKILDDSAISLDSKIKAEYLQHIEKIKNTDFQQLFTEYLEFKATNLLAYNDLLNPGVETTLAYLKRHNYKIGLASSSLKRDILRMLNTFDLEDYFDVVVSGEQFVQSKPNPEIYLHTLAALNLTCDQAVAIEDSEKGIAAAKAAGMKVWALKEARYPVNQSSADRLLNDLHEIPLVLKEEQKNK